ncbi:MAG TPA: PEP/pyruvate-binding domain-containing protein, partial [Anaerolineales bacterium]
MMDTIFRFEDLPSQKFPQAGGKASSLARMTQAGFPVPAGFVILAGAFDHGSLPADAQTALAGQLAALRRDDPAGSFAVRSSALSEDSARTSFAGEFETVLDAQTDGDIQAAIGRVLASARSERVQSYSQTLGVETDHSMAVVVQRMVHPEFSGVLFTADPISGSHIPLTGNYVRGLDEQLVSGEANAQDFQLIRPSGKYRGPQEFRKYARRMYRLATMLEKEFNTPLDIEWAVAGGQVFLLQARPVTTLQTIHYETYQVNESLDKDYL